MKFLRFNSFILTMLITQQLISAEFIKSSCDLPNKVFSDFVAQEFSGKTMKSSPDWKKLISWKNHEMGGDSWQIVEQSGEVQSCKKKDKTYVITTSSILLGESTYKGKDGSIPSYIIYSTPKKEVRTFVLIKEKGDWKIKTFSNENIPWISVKSAQTHYESLINDRCKSDEECEKIKMDTIADLKKLQTKFD